MNHDQMLQELAALITRRTGYSAARALELADEFLAATSCWFSETEDLEAPEIDDAELEASDPNEGCESGTKR